MSETVTLTVTDEYYWGRCPDCGAPGDFMRLRRDEWSACHHCHTRWLLGSSFACEQSDEESAAQSWEVIGGYRDVEPLMPPPPAGPDPWACPQCGGTGREATP